MEAPFYVRRQKSGWQTLQEMENVPISGLLVTSKVVRNQPELFEGGFEVIDEFLGDDVKYELWEMVPGTFFLP